MTTTDESLLWPDYGHPDDLAAIESVPLAQRGLPGTTYDLLVRAAARWPDRTALSVLPDASAWRTPRSRSYATLLGDVHQVANALTALGVGRSDAVALLAPNCDELVTALLGAQLAGIASPVNPGLSPEHVTRLVQRSGARVVVAATPELDRTAFDTAVGLARDGLVDHVVLVRPTAVEPTSPDAPAPAPADPPDAPGATVHLLHALAARQPRDVFVGEPPASTGLAAFFHTGGTTGTPKLAAHTHANEVADAWMLAASSLVTDDGVVFAALPLFHVNALVVTLLAPMFKGQHALWAGPLGYREPELYGCFWQLVEHHRISTMSAVPTVYAVLATVPVDADVSSMRFAMVGASALPAGVRRDFEGATGITLLEGYGLTEATCASVRAFPDLDQGSALGQRMPYQQVAVVAGRGSGDGDPWRRLPAGETGSIAISGPTVFAGYVEGHDGAAHVLGAAGTVHDGWLDTGDRGHVDERGFVHLTGRTKDLIIRGGHNIDPRLVEDAVAAHPDVTGVLAVGQPDRHAGEVPVAYVTLRAGSTAGEDDLRRYAAGRVAEAAAAPRAVRVVDGLPLTAIGKPHKVPLRADAARRAVAEALADVDGVLGVDASTASGDVVVDVTVAPGAAGADGAAEAVRRVLSAFALTATVTTAPGEDR